MHETLHCHQVMTKIARRNLRRRQHCLTKMRPRSNWWIFLRRQTMKHSTCTLFPHILTKHHVPGPCALMKVAMMIDACVVRLRGVFLKNRCYHRLLTMWAVIVVANDDGVWVDWDRVVVSILNTIEPILGYYHLFYHLCLAHEPEQEKTT